MEILKYQHGNASNELQEKHNNEIEIKSQKME